MSIEQKIIEAIQASKGELSRRSLFKAAVGAGLVALVKPRSVFGQSYPSFPSSQNYDMRKGIGETLTAIDAGLRSGRTLNVINFVEHTSISQNAFDMMLVANAKARYGDVFYGYEISHNWPVQYLNNYKQRNLRGIPASMMQPVASDWAQRFDPNGIETMKMLSTFAGPPNAPFSNYNLRANIVRYGIRSRPIDAAMDSNLMLDFSDPQTREMTKQTVGIVSANMSGNANNEMPTVGVVVRNRFMASQLVQNPARVRIITVGGVHGYERTNYSRPYVHSLQSFLEQRGENVLCVGLEQHAMPQGTRVAQSNLLLPSGIPIAYATRIPETEDRMLNRIFSASGAGQLFMSNAAKCPYGVEVFNKMPQWMGLRDANIPFPGCK